MKRLGAFDIGSNSFHLIIVEADQSGGFKILYREREVLRLGSNFGIGLNIISDDEINKSIRIVEKFYNISRKFNASLYGVATSAVREALNSNEFIKRIYDSTGLRIDIIDGLTESEFIYKGILAALEVFDKKSLCIDIGGGSTEFFVGLKGVKLYSSSAKLGAVKLTKEFFSGSLVTQDKILRCAEYIEEELQSIISDIQKVGFEICVGTSGTIFSIASILLGNNYKEGKKYLNNIVLSSENIFQISNELLRCATNEERMKLMGSEGKRADIISAGVLILKIILEKLLIKEVIISEYALREGIIVDLISRSHQSGKNSINRQ